MAAHDPVSGGPPTGGKCFDRPLLKARRQRVDVQGVQTTAPFPVATPAMDFAEASASVVDYLASTLPMGFWAVTRYDGERQLYLEVRDDAYGLAAGGSHLWADSFCVHMSNGRGPQIAPDAMAVPAYASSGVATQIDIGAYVGIPINRADGELFGTICGLDPQVQPDELTAQAPLLQLLSLLLSTILEADLQRTQLSRALERAEMAAETDPLTGLLNRRGWDRFLAVEEERYRRFGDPAGVIVIDLDRLKWVNDTEGHEAGDRYIAAAGQAIEGAVRGGDVVARLGGDEFGVLAGNLGPAGFVQLVERILGSFEAVGVAGSIGHAPYTVVAGFPGALAAADARMYAEKQRRREITARRAPDPVA